MKYRRFPKLLLTSLLAAVVGFCLSQILGVSTQIALIITASLTLAAGGTVLVVYGATGQLEKPSLLIAIVAVIAAVCVGIVTLVWYAIANSTDL